MPPASFRPHLTMDPLPLAVCLLWSYRTRDFHPLDYTHAGRTPLSGCAGLSQREACHLVLRSLPLPYSTAITDSLDSQVTHVPLRIQFTGVTQVPLPPLFRGQNRASLRLPAETYSGPLSFHAKTPLKNGLHFSGVFFLMFFISSDSCSLCPGFLPGAGGRGRRLRRLRGSGF